MYANVRYTISWMRLCKASDSHDIARDGVVTVVVEGTSWDKKLDIWIANSNPTSLNYRKPVITPVLLRVNQPLVLPQWQIQGKHFWGFGPNQRRRPKQNLWSMAESPPEVYASQIRRIKDSLPAMHGQLVVVVVVMKAAKTYNRVPPPWSVNSVSNYDVPWTMCT